MILCHKCSGILASFDDENITGLQNCSCISGYVRGFEIPVNREQAIQAQVNANLQRVTLYTRQDRSETEIQKVRSKAIELAGLQS